MKKSKLEKGITLIALIITIIVLLILAIVTIGAVKDSGIIKHANNAANNYEEAKEKELITLAYSEYIMDKQVSDTAALKVEGATVTEDKNSRYQIIFSESKNKYTMDKLGKIEKVEDDENKKEDITQKTWEMAWVCDGTSWGPEIINEGNTAEPQGQIVAKLCKTGETVTPISPFTGLEFVTGDAYCLKIEGSGTMSSVLDLTTYTGNAWMSDFIESMEASLSQTPTNQEYMAAYITDVIIGENINNIPENAFVYAVKLSNVSISTTVTTIGVQSFACCTNLTEVIIPSNVSYIGEGAFNTTGLLKVKILSTSLTAGDDCFDANPSDCKIYVLSDTIKTELLNDIASGNTIIVVTEEEMNEI